RVRARKSSQFASDFTSSATNGWVTDVCSSSTAYKRSLNSSLLSMCYLPVDDRAPEPCYRLGQVDARVLLVADPAVVGEPAVLLEPVGPPDPLGPDALADVQPEQVDADLFAVPHNRRERTGHHL